MIATSGELGSSCSEKYVLSTLALPWLENSHHGLWSNAKESSALEARDCDLQYADADIKNEALSVGQVYILKRNAHAELLTAIEMAQAAAASDQESDFSSRT
jgi:hypothetical protein